MATTKHIISKVRLGNTTTNNIVATIPKGSDIKKGDYVYIIKVESPKLD